MLDVLDKYVPDPWPTFDAQTVTNMLHSIIKQSRLEEKYGLNSLKVFCEAWKTETMETV